MSLQQQMSLFQEGGLEQDGNTVDPESGNDVPIGSSQEEVRDDIPAQLSEGEFVFPADVVRYLGLEFLMNLRQKAKAGLARMEEMGQMSNSEEATVPDDVPFTVDDLELENDERDMAQGGVVKAADGIATVRGGQNVDHTTKEDNWGREGGFRREPEVRIPEWDWDYKPPTNEQATFMNAPAEQPPTDETTDETTFESLLGSSPETYDELRKYVGPNGEISYIAFKDGKPLPAYVSKEQDLLKKGYVYEDPATVGEEEPTDPTNVGVETAQVRDREGDATDPMNMRKAEQERIKSFKSAIESVMKETGITDPAEAAQYLKDGNHKIKGIKVPGFLFKDFNLVDGVVDESGIARPATYGLDQAAEEVFSDQYSDTSTLDAMGGFDDSSAGVGTGGFSSNILGNVSGLASTLPSSSATTSSSQDSEAVQETDTSENTYTGKPGPPSLSDRPVEKINISGKQKYLGEKDSPAASAWKTKEIQDPSDIARTNAEIKRAKLEAVAKKSQELADKRQKEAEETRAKARAENKLGPNPSTRETMQKATPYRSGGRYGGFKEGGLASKKPKKKKTVMKRGGLASKK